MGNFVSRKSFALLSYLVLREEPHAREHLAGLLWGEMPERRAKANLRMALYNLRKLLPGYLMVTRTTAAFDREQPYWLDVEAFESELYAPEQIAGLRAAIELYRGEFLEDLYVEAAPDFEVWLLEQREYLRLSFLRALEKLAVQYVNRGDWVESIKVYRRLLSVDPLREDVHRRLMRTLARAGRYDAALEQYEICRQLLREELHVEPMPETTDLYERIRMVRSQPYPHNLPAHLTPFIGREEELGEITKLLRDPTCRLITLVGPGGIGKSRLALQAAAHVSHEGAFLEGVYLVPLASVRRAKLLASAIADALQLSFQGPKELDLQLLNYLRNKEILLVLDNFEHLIEGGTGLLTEVLTNAPKVKLLITSRQRLNLHQEWLLEIQGLRFPKSSPDSSPARAIVWEEAENYAAVQLFTERARRVQSNLFLSETERFAVVRICQLVEGMPLGIELAAPWVRTLSCQRIAKEIERGLRLLATSLRDVPERHRSMQAMFDHSWRFLSAEERSVIKRLSVFRGGFRREAARQVAGASLPILSALVDNSFLHRDPSGRYEMHELLRQYAAEKLSAMPQEKEKAHNLHCDNFASFLHHRADHLKGEKQADALGKIRPEIDNIRAAWRWAVERSRVEAIWKSLECLWGFYELRGWFREGEGTFRSAANTLAGTAGELDEMGEEFRLILGAVLARWGWFCWRIGRYIRSKEVLHEGLTLLRRAGSGARREVSFSLQQLGIIGWYLGEYLKSRQLWRESLAISREVGDQFISALSLMGLAFAAHSLGEYTEAKQWYQESLAGFRANNDQRGLANVLVWAGGRFHLGQGEFREAERRLRQGMAICKQIKDSFGIALALTHLGLLVHVKADYLEAKRLHQESLEIFKEIGDQWGAACALTGLGYATCSLGEHEGSDRHFREAIKIAVKIGTLPVALDALAGLGTLLGAGEQEQMERALGLLIFVLHHSASSHETKNKAARLFAEMEVELAPQVVSAAQKRGQANTLEAVVEEILGESQ